MTGLIIALLVLGWFLQTAILLIYIKKLTNPLGQNALSTYFQKPFLDLTERLTDRMSRSQAELRQSLSDALNKSFFEAHERTERSHLGNRKELQEGLQRTTQALETKFQSLEKQVGLRL